jgi:hypothetical protein
MDSRIYSARTNANAVIVTPTERGSSYGRSARYSEVQS